ncbi:hypothetical protein BS47DRAFT_1386036 [Hydnum rufescens UP504]|uniref:NACHT domain-containing protein n=1 Tax=Hydnum rufescens UP504 TaxID=1448309 RepID=A0A9P6AHT3_9AGAM|nr:hypothetical protein BS47DRAFT_1386036 [Hydnum rufescens UP504]
MLMLLSTPASMRGGGEDLCGNGGFFLNIDGSSGFDRKQKILSPRSLGDLEHIASSVQLKSSAGGVRRFLERKKDEHDLATFSQNVKAALDRFQLSQTLRQEQELFLEKRSAAVMSLPRANSAAYDSGREDAPSSCLKGTRVSILTEIMSWFENMESSTPPVYWLVGLAGIGKSTIAKTVAERAEENGMLGASFFFSRSDAPLRDPNLVFPTLAFQLAQSDNEFKNVIGEAIQQDATLGHKKPLAQFEGLILKPLGQLDSTRQMTLIVLDALDECKEQGAATILQLLLSHASRLPFLRILITSRPEPHISSVFTEAKNLAKRVLHDIEASVIGGRPPALHTPHPSDSLVTLVFEILVLSKESEATPYSQLDSLYVGVLRNSLSDSNRKAIVKRFQTVVGSIVLLRQPLPLGSLAQFVQCTLDDVHTALRHLRSVIIPPSIPEEAPRIYHPSFRDFITDPSRCSIPDFVIVAVPDQELRHALRCLELMATFLRQDVAGISDVSLLNSEVKGLEEKVRDALSAEVHAVALIEEAHRWACEAMVIALLADARRFLLAHRELIRGSALQVYHSALAFTPYDTALYKTYSKDVQSCIRVLQGVEAQWPQSLSTLVGHSGVVNSVAFSPDGLWLASGSDDCTLCLWDAMSGEQIATLEAHSNSVESVAFSPNGSWLASGSWDDTLCLWDAKLGKCIVTLRGSWDDTLCLWDAMSGIHIATLHGHFGVVSSVAFSPDGVWLASGSWDATLCLWDAISGKAIGTLHSHSDQVFSVAFSPDGLHLASGSKDHTICLWDTVLGVHIATLQGHSGTVRSVAFSPNGSWLASGSHDETICLWDAMSGTHIATLHGHSHSVTSVTFSPDSLWLASGSVDQTLCLWDPMLGSRDKTLCLWDVMSGAHIATLQGHHGSVTSVTFSPDSVQLASGSSDHTVCLWDVVSATHIGTLQGHSDEVTSVAFSPDGLQLGSGSRDNTVCLWDLMLGAHIATSGHSSDQDLDQVHSVAFSPNGLLLASGSWDSSVYLLDAMSGAQITTLHGHSDGVTLVAFSPDGLWLASGSFDHTGVHCYS